MKRSIGFTLTEILVALAILGIIATFTIPKVLQSQQQGKYAALGKEAILMLDGAYKAYQMDHAVTATTMDRDLTPYMNYVKVDTTSTIDRTYNDSTITCSNSYPCLQLHNGAKMLFDTTTGSNFGNTAATNATYVYFDPDGKSNPSTTGDGKSVGLWIYYSGRITTWGRIINHTYSGDVDYSPQPASDPPWFEI